MLFIGLKCKMNHALLLRKKLAQTVDGQKDRTPNNLQDVGPPLPPNFNVVENDGPSAPGVRFLLYPRWVSQKVFQH